MPDEVLGQEAVLGEGSPLRELIARDTVPSAVLWGPPGSGKTTVARLVQAATKKSVVSFSAVASGTKEVRAVLERATQEWKSLGRGILVFVDEIHHFNKTQQDIFLPHVEEGSVTLLATTTENPSFYIISPLLSRCQVYVFNRLDTEHVEKILRRAIHDAEKGLAKQGVQVPDSVVREIAERADGDARRALNTLEVVSRLAAPGSAVTAEILQKALAGKVYRYDRDREEHYNVISAFIKSMRGSDADAAVYWLARMLEAGEEPLFIARRLVIFASEDVGNADPQAIQVAVSAMQSLDFVGMPEGYLPLAQATTYLATAPKSNASYKAYLEAKGDVKRMGTLDVPVHLRNAPTEFMEGLGYGRDYVYPHDASAAGVRQSYLPKSLEGRQYYRPKPVGYEEEIAERMKEWDQIREKAPDGTPRSGSRLPTATGKAGRSTTE